VSGSPSPTDEDLVRSYLAGDPSAFEELVRRHERRTYNLALRVLGREEDARDATQDAFLTALRKLGSFRGDAAFTTWLHRVTVNACYDMLRKRARQPLLRVVGEEEEPSPEPGPPVGDHADAVAGETDVARALARVPLEFRAVLVLHDLQDHAYEDVARILDVPVGTVKSRLHRGRIALARELGLAPARERRADARASEEEP
jgi:RNA polymerase sigma-70 factor (ECF subfamily)